MGQLLYLLYNLILTAALPFAWVAAYFNDKLGGSLTGQQDIKAQLATFRRKVDKDPKPVVWLHAASAGEFEQIKPLLARIKAYDVYLFQTFTSATIYYKAYTHPLFDGVSFLPWDTWLRTRRFIKRLQPTLFINTRHDLWPNLLTHLKGQGVRNILINANLYPNSKRLQPALKGFNAHIFGKLDAVYTGSSDLEALIKQLYTGPLHVVGDTRFDQVQERAAANDMESLEPIVPQGQRVCVYGSVVDSDLDVICQAIAAADVPSGLLHIVVPHEVQERDILPWEVALYRQGIKTIRYSEIADYAGEPVVLWNQVGRLADLYKFAHLAYIGAGFTTGVHSVTEAAIYHVPAAHGPRYDILAEAVELVDLKLSTVVTDGAELTTFLEQSEEAIQTLNRELATFMDARLGASDAIVAAEFPLAKRADA